MPSNQYKSQNNWNAALDTTKGEDNIETATWIINEDVKIKAKYPKEDKSTSTLDNGGKKADFIQR